MKYISIGSACSVKYNIDKYRHKNKTLFFDWLMTDMNSVIKILECNNINDILYFDNISRDVDCPYFFNNSKIVIKSLPYCVSIHDLPIKYTDNDILNFIEKYRRRFNRIVNYIKSKKKLCFIRIGCEDYDTIYKFIETIKKINIHCDFTIVVIDNDKKNNTEILKQNNFLHIKLNIDKPSEEKKNGWTLYFLNWNNIFLDIEKNIKIGVLKTFYYKLFFFKVQDKLS
jgi:hypothetical protein